ncbi:MAG: nucleotide pyrophosphohydrolase [Beggiatoa sp. IS2]|nr:MAG: nucleotide pyrophosphohydrolase [Beggiatoa sp. IS2]
MSIDNLEQLRQQVAKFAADRDWEQFHSPKNLSMALIAEVAELIEHFQWLTPEQSYQLSPEKRQAVSHELADIFIYLIRLADKLNIDLMTATQEKIKINESRYPIALVKGNARRAAEYSDQERESTS